MCPVPGEGNNTKAVKVSMYKFPDMYTYECITGYVPTGDMDSSCTANGNWSLQPPSCERKLFIIYSHNY